MPLTNTNAWQTITLGDLFDITSSKRVYKSEWKTEGIPFYRAREIVKLAKYGSVDNDLYISEDMYIQYAKKHGIPKAGDILVTGVGTLGITYVVQANDKFYFKDGNIIWLKKREDVDSRFVEYAFKSQLLRKQIDDGLGATVGTYTIIKAKNTRIPIPPLPEQKRIVAILDEAFEAIKKAKENAEKNLQNAQELFDSYLQSVFECAGEDWMTCNLEDYIKFIDYRGRTPKKTESGLRLTTAKNVKRGYVRKEPEEFVSPDIYDSWMVRGIPKKGDVLFTTEAPLANVAQLDTDEKVVFAQRIIILQPEKNKLNQTFLKYLLMSQPIQNRILGKGTGATVKGIKASLLKKIEISFPELSEQQSIVANLDVLSNQTKKLKSLYTQKLSALDELKQSLLKKAFAGEL